MKIAVGTSILIGAFIARSSDATCSPVARLLCLDLQHLPERAPELLCLDQRVDDGRQLGNLDTDGHLAKRVGKTLTDAKLREDEKELLHERPFEILAQTSESRVEAEAAFDADGEDVERVRQLAPHLVAAAPRSRGDDDVRAEKAERTPGERDQDCLQRVPDAGAEQQTDSRDGRAEHHSEGQKPDRRDASREPCRHEPEADPLLVARGSRRPANRASLFA